MRQQSDATGLTVDCDAAPVRRVGVPLANRLINRGRALVRFWPCFQGLLVGFLADNEFFELCVWASSEKTPTARRFCADTTRRPLEGSRHEAGSPCVATSDNAPLP